MKGDRAACPRSRGSKLPRWCFAVSVRSWSLGCVEAQLTPGQKKGRELNAPSPEAPRSAYQESTPSRARLGACSVGLLVENSRFSGETRSRSYAKCFLDGFYIVSSPLLVRRFMVPARLWQAHCGPSTLQKGVIPMSLACAPAGKPHLRSWGEFVRPRCPNSPERPLVRRRGAIRRHHGARLGLHASPPRGLRLGRFHRQAAERRQGPLILLLLWQTTLLKDFAA